jgi:hypothetical protein
MDAEEAALLAELRAISNRSAASRFDDDGNTGGASVGATGVAAAHGNGVATEAHASEGEIGTSSAHDDHPPSPSTQAGSQAGTPGRKSRLKNMTFWKGGRRKSEEHKNDEDGAHSSEEVKVDDQHLDKPVQSPQSARAKPWKQRLHLTSKSEPHENAVVNNEASEEHTVKDALSHTVASLPPWKARAFAARNQRASINHQQNEPLTEESLIVVVGGKSDTGYSIGGSIDEKQPVELSVGQHLSSLPDDDSGISAMTRDQNVTGMSISIVCTNL